MQIEFIGPLDRVTGSCTWMHDQENGWNFLVDCGMQQGEGQAENWNTGKSWPFDPTKLKFVLLTHAHIDHSGLIPLLYKLGFRGKTICTAETAEIAKVMLADTAKLGAPYTQIDIDKISWQEPKSRSLLGGHLHAVDKNLFVNFYRTSHIVGAVSIGIYWGEVGTPDQKKIVFSGDIGTSTEHQENLPLLRHMLHPHEFDYAVIESTYGSTLRSGEELTPEYRWRQLADVLDGICSHNSSALFPAFSLGRIQDLLFDFHWVINSSPERYNNVQLVLDSPTANRLTPIILKALERTEVIGKDFKKVRSMWLGKQIFRWLELDDSDPEQVDRALDIIRLSFGLPEKHPMLATKFGNSIAKTWRTRLKVLSDVEQRSPLMQSQPTIVIASAGSCDGGKVTQWLPKIMVDEHNFICFTGYSAAGTVAAEILDIQNLELKERRRLRGNLAIPQANIEIAFRDIQCDIRSIRGYSAHADQRGLLGWLFWSFKGEDKSTAPHVFIQHGDDHDRKALRNAIVGKGASTTVVMPDSVNNKFSL